MQPSTDCFENIMRKQFNQSRSYDQSETNELNYT